jgi:uncharacterized membrane protein
MQITVDKLPTPDCTATAATPDAIPDRPYDPLVVGAWALGLAFCVVFWVFIAFILWPQSWKLPPFSF